MKILLKIDEDHILGTVASSLKIQLRIWTENR